MTSAASATVGDPLVGRLLDGRYQITQRLARGGMATVYRGVDTRLTRTVAVKIMHVGLGDDVEFARKFDREARAAARLSHPNVVSVFDQGEDTVDGHVSRPYIVMEYVEGRTLRDLINARAPMEPGAAIDLLEPVVAALAAAHDAGLVHRDVKPENVLIGDRGRVKVADFGLAKAISSQTQTATQGLLIGTVSYLPPELVVSGTADARADVYSAGVVLFELLTGLKPHTGDTPIQVAYAHVHHDVPAPSTFATAGEIPPYLDALVARATARDPDLRPPDGRVLLAQLRRVRAALAQGLRDDPELTIDLAPRPTPRPAAGRGFDDAGFDDAGFDDAGFDDPGSYDAGGDDAGSQDADGARTEVVGDRADFESTQLVSSGDGAAYAADARPSYYTPAHHAPPPAVPPREPAARGRAGVATMPAAQAARVAAHRARAARKRRRGWLALLLVLLLTTVAALAGWYLTEGRFTSMPALTTLPRADAVQVAERADLQVGFTDGYSETVPAGDVVSTDPVPGTKVRKGSQISAVVSRGPERFAMPVVVGLTQAAASTTLQQAHLKAGSVKKAWSDTVATGVVLSCGQRAGAQLKRDTAVGLVVSKGPKPVSVTDWSGRSVDQAVAALQQAGLVVTVTQDHSAEVAAGLVLSQTPRSGQVARGTTVTVVRSTGPALVTVPNVQNMRVSAAEETMKAAGFATEVKLSVLAIGGGDAFVLSTNPGPAAQAPEGSTITLFAA